MLCIAHFDYSIKNKHSIIKVLKFSIIKIKKQFQFTRRALETSLRMTVFCNDGVQCSRNTIISGEPMINRRSPRPRPFSNYD